MRYHQSRSIFLASFLQGTWVCYGGTHTVKKRRGERGRPFHTPTTPASIDSYVFICCTQTDVRRTRERGHGPSRMGGNHQVPLGSRVEQGSFHLRRAKRKDALARGIPSMAKIQAKTCDGTGHWQEFSGLTSPTSFRHTYRIVLFFFAKCNKMIEPERCSRKMMGKIREWVGSHNGPIHGPFFRIHGAGGPRAFPRYRLSTPKQPQKDKAAIGWRGGGGSCTTKASGA